MGQPRGLQEQSVRIGPVGRTKPRFQTSPVQTARDALRGRGGHHYRGNPPQLRYTPIANAASHCRGNPSLLRYTPTADSASRCQGNPSLLRYTPTADAACRCRGNPLQQRDSAAGRGGEQQNSGARASLTTAGRSLGRQTVASLPPSWAGHLNGHRKIKPEPPNTEHLRKKGFF